MIAVHRRAGSRGSVSVAASGVAAASIPRTRSGARATSVASGGWPGAASVGVEVGVDSLPISSLPSRARPPSGYQTAPPLPHRQRAPAAEPGQDRGPLPGTPGRVRPPGRRSFEQLAVRPPPSPPMSALMDERGGRPRPLGFGADTGRRTEARGGAGPAARALVRTASRSPGWSAATASLGQPAAALAATSPAHLPPPAAAATPTAYYRTQQRPRGLGRVRTPVPPLPRTDDG